MMRFCENGNSCILQMSLLQLFHFYCEKKEKKELNTVYCHVTTNGK